MSWVTRRVLMTAAAVVVSAGLVARAQQTQQPQPPAGGQPAAGPAPSSTPPAAQNPPATPAPAQPGAAKAPASGAAAGLGFTAEAGFVIFTVRAEGASDFEAFFAKVKEALEKGTKPEYKEMAAGWTFFRVAEAPQSGQILYASLIDPAVKGADYDPVKILGDVFPADATALYPKVKDILLSVNRLNLQPAMKMGGS